MHRLPPTPAATERRTLCASPSNLSECDWTGRALNAPLFNTPKYIIDSAFFNRMLVRCGTDDPRRATLHYIPYPLGDLWRSRKVRQDAVIQYERDVKATLRSMREWHECGGCNFFMVTARAWSDLACTKTGRWSDVERQGSRRQAFCLEDPFWAHVLKLSVEVDAARVQYPNSLRIPNLYAVPYESAIHVTSAAEMAKWQAKVSASRRSHLMTLVTSSHAHRRGSIMAACRQLNGSCTLYDCRLGEQCSSKRKLYRVYLRSHFCLMPEGDTPSRNAMFDALACGCVPVVFHRASFSYPWYVPNASELVLFVPSSRTPPVSFYVQQWLNRRTAGKLVRMPTLPERRVADALACIGPDGVGKAAAYRERIVRALPWITYSQSRLGPPDAITMALMRMRTTIEARRLKALDLGLL